MGLVCKEVDEFCLNGSETSDREMARQMRDMGREPSEENEAEGGSVTGTQLRIILDRQEYRCAMTGEPLTPENTSLDHINPLRRGGNHSADNIQFVLPEINRMKGTMPREEFVRMCRLVASHQ